MAGHPLTERVYSPFVYLVCLVVPLFIYPADRIE